MLKGMQKFFGIMYMMNNLMVVASYHLMKITMAIQSLRGLPLHLKKTSIKTVKWERTFYVSLLHRTNDVSKLWRKICQDYAIDCSSNMR